MTSLLLFAFLSITVSFICSVLEAVLLSITPTFISRAAKDGHAWAATLEEFKEDIDRPLIAILSLNTIAHTVGAIGVGSTAEAAFGNSDGVVGIVSAVMTVLILVVSEIIPKTIGATYWKKLAGLATRMLKFIMWPMKWSGLLWFLQLTTKLIGKNAHVNAISIEDFEVMTDRANEEGMFQGHESKVIKNMLRFSEIGVEDIMTPRAVMFTANADQTIRAFQSKNKGLRFSRIPVWSETHENITGLVLKDAVLEAIIEGRGDEKLSSIQRSILATQEGTPIPEVFDALMKKTGHLAMVMDDYGSITGLVTVEDVVETLLGLEIVDEYDDVVDLQQLARKRWVERAKRMGITLPQQSDGETQAQARTETA